MAQKREELVQRIKSLQQAIRRKYKQFKYGVVDSEGKLEKQYKPLIKELRKTTSVNTKVKSDPEEEIVVKDSFQPKHTSSPQRQQYETTQFISDGDVFEDKSPTLREMIQSPSALKETSQYVVETFEAPITRKYMLKFMKGETGANNKIDNIYGPRIDRDNLMVGNELLTFDKDGNIHLKNVQYKGTEGLYELLFKRQPDDSVYTDDDLNAYKDLLLKSNAHKKDYLPNKHVNRPSNSIKYKTIVSSLFPKQFYGKGFKSLAERDISYWDDPNELCARLKLLVGSAEVGNTAHTNEIQNIVEELREAKLISGRGNSKYKSIVQ